MRKIFEIDRDRLLALTRRELEQAETFDRNIRGAAERFAAHLTFDDGRCFSEAVRFNRHYRTAHLERAAAVLELVGYFDAANETANHATLSRKLDELANGEEEHHEEA